jgi:hypothetical protein
MIETLHSSLSIMLERRQMGIVIGEYLSLHSK